ncbi:hypothetical protein Bca52824_052988 [Brassica carinata]|uniref:Uncharacterized protein n=1 Tax=Brassica carinata TaxID=52824 RepID=A0A8X7R329_BRACI|nr:hypothetical protein Bca52824_052988 [Brassica carinata]
MLLVRELGDISETTVAGVLATAEGTESLNTRVSSKLMLFRNFEVKNASSLLVAELVVAAAEAVIVKDKSDGKKKKQARRLRKVEINGKAGGWSILAQSKWSRLEIEVSMDAARVSPCGSPCNSLRSWVLQPIYKFRSGQGSNPWADTPARVPIPLDQSNGSLDDNSFTISINA